MTASNFYDSTLEDDLETDLSKLSFADEPEKLNDATEVFNSYYLFRICHKSLGGTNLRIYFRLKDVLVPPKRINMVSK